MTSYTGRFAPSPTGPLHFGSLVAALASFLDAKHHQGKWLVRMEDIDPPREQAGAASDILNCLEAHHLHWDDQVLYQSTRADAYQQTLASLESKKLLYRCTCSRQTLKEQTIYPGTCRHRGNPKDSFASVRIDTQQALALLDGDPVISFNDLVTHKHSLNILTDVGDFIVHRKDGLFAYQLAVVVDDIEQGITHIIRGADLLDSSFRQILLFKVLGAEIPQFGHIPLVKNELGQKLCKQHHAPAVDQTQPSQNLFQALEFLGQTPPVELAQANPDELLQWAVAHWQLAAASTVQ